MFLALVFPSSSFVNFYYHFYLYLVVMFFLLYSLWHQPGNQGQGVRGHFAWRVHVQESSAHLFCLYHCKNWRDCDSRSVMGHVKTMPLQVSLLSLLPHTGAPAKSVDVYLCTLLADTFVYNNSVQTKIHSDLPCFVIHLSLFFIYIHVRKLPITRLEVYIPLKYCKASIFESCETL